MGLALGLGEIKIVETLSGAFNRKIGLAFGLAFGLVYGLTYGLAGGLAGGLAFGLAVGLAWGLADGLTYGLAVGLGTGLVGSGRAVLQHAVLRTVLWHSGDVPRNYARFLDYAAGLILLRKVGGGYIFVHRLLLDYFAADE